MISHRREHNAYAYPLWFKIFMCAVLITFVLLVIGHTAGWDPLGLTGTTPPEEVTR